MERVTLEVEPREAAGSPAARSLRRTGKIPGVLYGTGRDSMAVTIDPVGLRRALSTDAGRNAIIDVVVPGEKKPVPSILKDLQLHPVRDRVTHVDLLAVRLDRPIQASVHIVLIGEAEGVKLGGEMQVPIREVVVEALPTHIPDSIEADVSHLLIGDSLRISEVKLPDDVTLISDPDSTIASVARPARARARDRRRGRRGRGRRRGRGCRGRGRGRGLRGRVARAAAAAPEGGARGPARRCARESRAALPRDQAQPRLPAWRTSLPGATAGSRLATSTAARSRSYGCPTVRRSRSCARSST